MMPEDADVNPLHESMSGNLSMAYPSLSMYTARSTVFYADPHDQPFPEASPSISSRKTNAPRVDKEEGKAVKVEEDEGGPRVTFVTVPEDSTTSYTANNKPPHTNIKQEEVREYIATNSRINPHLPDKRSLSQEGIEVLTSCFFRCLGSYYNRPAMLLFWSFLLAWIYTMIPVSNYWIYFLIKNQYWVVLTLVTYMEIQFVNIPDLSDSSYIAAYVGGFFLAPLAHIIRYYYNLENNFEISSLSVLFSFVIVMVVTGYDCFTQPKALSRPHQNHHNNQEYDDPNNPLSQFQPMFAATQLWKLSYSSSIPEDVLEGGGVHQTSSSPGDGVVAVARDLTEPMHNRAADNHNDRVISADSLTSSSSSNKRQSNRVASMESNTYRSPLSSAEVEMSPSSNTMSSAAWKIYRDNSKTSIDASSDTDRLKSDLAQKPASEWDRFESVSINSSIDRNSSYFKRKPTASGDESIFSCLLCLCCFHTMNKKWFFFLPRYWDEEYYRSLNSLKRNTDRRWMWLIACVFNVFYSLNYAFLIYFTEYFRSNRNNNRTRVVLFAVYIVTNTVLRFTLKSIGMYLDRQKQKSVSMYFIGEVISLFFYYTFYRVLFESIDSIVEFAAFQILHLSSEWVLYVGRSTHWYFQLTETLGQKYWSPFLPTPRLSHRSWQVFVTLDFGIRCAVFVATGYGMLLLLATVQFIPWVRHRNDLFENHQSFVNTCLLIVVAVVLELINAIAIHFIYFQHQKLNLLAEVRHCFSIAHFALLAMMVGANLFINPIFAFTTGVTQF